MSVVAAQYAIIAGLVMAAAVVILRFEMSCLRELSAAADSELQYLTRPAWAAVIIVVIPLGGIAYLCCGRARW